jgi:hypothetical protein
MTKTAFSCWLVPALFGCNIGVSASRINAMEPKAEVSGEVEELPLTSVAKSICPKGFQVPQDGIIDNLEDGNTQLQTDSDRDGYWWTAKDPNGSTIEPSQGFAPVAGGPAGSNQAIHVWGATADGDQAWGVNVGFNFSSAGLYDASRYVGLRFVARVEPGTTKKVRFKIGDVNTHQDAGVCEACWNHFGKDLALAENWQRHTVLFKEMAQAPGWGLPRPPALSADKVYSLDFSIDKAQTFDLWVDELEFLECVP